MSSTTCQSVQNWLEPKKMTDFNMFYLYSNHWIWSISVFQNTIYCLSYILCGMVVNIYYDSQHIVQHWNMLLSCVWCWKDHQNTFFVPKYVLIFNLYPPKFPLSLRYRLEMMENVLWVHIMTTASQSERIYITGITVSWCQGHKIDHVF